MLGLQKTETQAGEADIDKKMDEDVSPAEDKQGAMDVDKEGA